MYACRCLCVSVDRVRESGDGRVDNSNAPDNYMTRELEVSAREREGLSVCKSNRLGKTTNNTTQLTFLQLAPEISNIFV